MDADQMGPPQGDSPPAVPRLVPGPIEGLGHRLRTAAPRWPAAHAGSPPTAGLAPREDVAPPRCQ
eukprot:scaffold834_cov311-Prasinococcus_capsulatus_cf.AAC.10